VRTFKTKAFNRFAEKAGISDAALCQSKLAQVVAAGALVEVKCDEETIP
jgi:hypothetical protein